MILYFKSMETIKLLKYFKGLKCIDKLRLSIHLLESKYLGSDLDIDKNKEIQTLEKRLIELDSSYATTITNFSNYRTLTFLSAKFMELAERDRNTFVLEMLDNVCIYK